MTRCRRFVPLCLFVCALGCGVDKYEERMINTQTRMDRWEKEARDLDAPLQIPSRMVAVGKEQKPISFVNVFIRPPKGIYNMPDNAKEPRDRMMFTFKAKSAGGPFLYVEVGQADKAAEFPNEVLNSLRPSTKTEWRKREIKPLGRPPITFVTTEFEDGQAFYSVNVWRTPPSAPTDQVAIVYVAALAHKAAAIQLINQSLETFATGVEGSKARDFAAKGPFEVPGHPNQ